MNGQNSTELAKRHVLKKIARLNDAATDPSARALRAKLANTSRGIEDPEVWSVLFSDIDPALMARSKTGAPSTPELAIVTALTLFARHHRVNDSAQQHGVSLGTALARLFRARGGGTSEDAANWSYYRQMISAFRSQDTASQVIPIARIVRLLISEKSIGLDYARLAAEIIGLSNPNASHYIQLSWGRDYWRVINGEDRRPATDTTDTENAPVTEGK